MKHYYIRGNDQHPERVIAALNKLGGYNPGYNGEDTRSIYFINPQGNINWAQHGTMLYNMLLEYGEEIFPEPDYKFKVGDKVKIKHVDRVDTITELVNSKGTPAYRTVTSTLTEEQIEPYTEPQILTWEDMVKAKAMIKGCAILNCSSDIFYYGKDSNYTATQKNRNVYHTEGQAKSALAMAQISQLIKQTVYGGAITDDEWGDNDLKKYNIWRDGNSIRIGYTYAHYEFLAFHTLEQAELFFKHNEQLVKDYLMLS